MKVKYGKTNSCFFPFRILTENFEKELRQTISLALKIRAQPTCVSFC